MCGRFCGGVGGFSRRGVSENPKARFLITRRLVFLITRLSVPENPKIVPENPKIVPENPIRDELGFLKTRRPLPIVPETPCLRLCFDNVPRRCGRSLPDNTSVVQCCGVPSN